MKLLIAFSLSSFSYYYLKDPINNSVINASFWGKTQDNQRANLYQLQNKNLILEASDYGGIITKLLVPDKYGKLEDIVLGCQTLQQYEQKSPHFGCITGRVAGRIANSKFELNGQTYHLEPNRAPDHLHGGTKALDKRIYKTQIVQSENKEPGLKFNYISKDGDNGYPGDLDLSVTYWLLNNNSLRIDYYAEVLGKSTIINVTNHSYFNLSGQNAKEDINNHFFKVNSQTILESNEGLIPTGNFLDTKDTPFDFYSEFVSLGNKINDKENKQIVNAGGYDHSFVLKKENSDQLVYAASLYEGSSGRLMDVFTTEPSVHLYTGNFLHEGIPNKDGSNYFKRAGLCLETQHFPNSINVPSFPSILLNPGEKFRSSTIFQFRVANFIDEQINSYK